MLAVKDIEVRAGAKLLLAPVSFQIIKGDRIGLVGRNGAGKTTLTKILAGEALPASGLINRSGQLGYLPQDTHTGEPTMLARDRILSARGLDQIIKRMKKFERLMSETTGDNRDKNMGSYARAEAEFVAAGGYACESQAARIAANLGLPERILNQQLHTLSGGQRRRVELARILFSDAETLLLDEPTNHLDADSIVWLRSFLQGYSGGLLIISHDTDLLNDVVNKVFHLDANRTEMDIYAMDWRRYLIQRDTDEKRRKRERASAERKASQLLLQADKMRAKATKAVAAQNMAKRAERLLSSLEEERAGEKVAKIRFPEPTHCGKTPLSAKDLSKSYGSLEVFTCVDLAIDKGSKVVVLGLNGAGKTTLLRLLSQIEKPDTGEIIKGHGLKIGYYAQEHETLNFTQSVLENMMRSATELNETEMRKVLGSFLFSGDEVNKPASVLSGGEKTRLSLAMLMVSKANVLLLDEPTNNLDPVSRAEVLNALKDYAGAVILVTHDEGAVEALEPERVLILPDGVEDLWSQDYLELTALA